MIEVVDTCVRFGADSAVALEDVSLVVRPGELVALVGSNGSGKSTLGKLLCAGLLTSAGSVSVDGCNPSAGDAERRCVRSAVGMVCQDPLDQIVATRVADEVAFGPRNLGLSEDEVRDRVHEALVRTGLDGFEDRDSTTLSGGEQQRVAIAGMLAMRPRYVVFDEATAQLDAAARPAFRELFRCLAHRDALGVVQITHDPVEILASDRIVVLDSGHLVWEGTPVELLATDDVTTDVLPVNDAYAQALRALFQADMLRDGIPPTPTALLQRLVRVQGGAARQVLNECYPAAPRAHSTLPDELDFASDSLLTMRDVSFAYGDAPVLDGVDLDVHRGNVLLLAGRSGSGKSTLAQLACGLLKPDAGTVLLSGKQVRTGDVACAFQSPERQFFCDTVFDELAFAPRAAGMSEETVRKSVERAAKLVGIDAGLFDRDPFDLSGGQARRVALASALSMSAGVCILDEPTAGLDVEGRRSIRVVAQTLAAEGRAVIVISHDLDEWLGSADEVALLGKGRIVWHGASAACDVKPELFARCGLVAPFAAQVSAAVQGGVATAPVPSDAIRRIEVPAAAAAPLARFDARIKITGLLALALCVFLCHTPVAIAVWLLVAGFLLRWAGLGPRRALLALRPVCFVLAFALCANLVSCDGGADFVVAGPVGIDASAGARGLVAVLRIVVLVAGSIAVAETTLPTEVSDAVVRLLRPLARLGLPVGALGTVLSIALRFIPLVGGELQRIRNAQKVRGVRFDEGSIFCRMRAWAAVLTPLIVGLFRRADRLAVAMAARCYAGAGAVQVPRRALATGDRCAVLLIVAACVLTLVLALGGLI